MRKKINPALLNEEQKIVVQKFTDENVLFWSGRVLIENINYTEERDEIKVSIRSQLKIEQNEKCAYCGLKIREETPAIEHIADKSKLHFKNQMFNVHNLVLSCGTCNFKKSRRSASDVYDGPYLTWNFLIVHPIIDTPSEHIVFDENFIHIIQVLSDKGKKTVEWFDLKGPIMLEERTKEAMFSALEIPSQFEEIIEEAIKINRTKR